MYPGSFDDENEKNSTGTANHINRNIDRSSNGQEDTLFFFHQSRMLSKRAADVNIVHGTKSEQSHWQVIPEQAQCGDKDP